MLLMWQQKTTDSCFLLPNVSSRFPLNLYSSLGKHNYKSKNILKCYSTSQRHEHILHSLLYTVKYNHVIQLKEPYAKVDHLKMTNLHIFNKLILKLRHLLQEHYALTVLNQ